MKGKIVVTLAVIVALASLLIVSGCMKKAPKKETAKAPVQTTSTIPSFSYEIAGFKYKSYNVADVKSILAKSETEIADKLKQVKQAGSVQVIGHADKKGPEGPEGDKIGNLAWSSKRAEAVVDYFVSKFGISRDIFSIKGVGSDELKDENKPFDAQNRRVEIIYNK